MFNLAELLAQPEITVVENSRTMTGQRRRRVISPKIVLDVDIL